MMLRSFLSTHLTVIKYSQIIVHFVVHFPTLPLEHSFMAKGPAQFTAHSRHPAITCQMIKFVKTKKKKK